jgi:hypothetical protein
MEAQENFHGGEGMRAYIYQADILCESCAREVMDDLRARGLEPTDPVLREDSDTWPVGPFPNGGGESDAPQHCGACGIFLENPLTPEGEQYVRRISPAVPVAPSSRGSLRGCRAQKNQGGAT